MVGSTLTLGDASNTGVGQITATSLTKAGGGVLQMNADQATFTGPIYVGAGSLTLWNQTVAAGNGTSNAGTKGGTITLGADNMTLNLRSNTTGVLTFNTSLLMAAGNPRATISVDRTTNAGTIAVNALTLGGSPGEQGQALTIGHHHVTCRLGPRLGITRGEVPVRRRHHHLRAAVLQRARPTDMVAVRVADDHILDLRRVQPERSKPPNHFVFD